MYVEIYLSFSPVYLMRLTMVSFLYNFFVLYILKVENPSATNRKRRAWSESEDDEPVMRQPESSPIRENSADMQVSDGD